MAPPEPFCREAGSGPGVVCLHSNASSSAQWRALIERLAPRHHVFAPDLHDSGRGPPWPSDREIRLVDEMALVEPVLTRAGSPLALVGHSYGAAVALMAALAEPGRVAAMALYEPTLFGLIDAESPAPNAADGIRDAVGASAAALDAGDPAGAAECFIDYWMGRGTWAGMPAERKPAIEASATNVRRWAHALFTEPTPRAAFLQLDVPVLCMIGGRTTASARAVTRLLAATLPRVEVVEFEALGHMGPVTDPDVVNDAIAGFLGAHLPPAA
ncbi:MAG: alpha/beta hydrolase [Caldimonas sp.]